MLTRDQAKKYYDRYANKQDTQAFYEDPALESLIAHARFGTAHHVFELGCGTGRLAEELLTHHLPAEAGYLGYDLSTTMVTLARSRLSPVGTRAQVSLTSGSFPWPLKDKSVDRVVVGYVLDLLPEDEIEAVLVEAARVLGPGGLLCLANLTSGTTLRSKLNIWRWTSLYRINPWWFGGCRPLQMLPRLGTPLWALRHHEIVVASAVPSEVIVAERTASDLSL